MDQLLMLDNSKLFRVVYVARSKVSLISKDYDSLNFGLSWESTLNSSTEAPLSLKGLLYFLSKSPNPAVLVDNTSNSQIANFYPEFLQAGISIATPNKIAFSSELDLWNSLFSSEVKGLIYYESTVGAGLPIISTLKDMLNTNDKIEKIEGILSGTLSYIFNEFSTVFPNKTKFSEVVKIASQLGYTEPDPRNDLNGLDVARKVTILARMSGFNVESSKSFPVESLIPKPLESVESIAEFMEKLPEYDDKLDKLKDEAMKENKVLRFVGKVDFCKSSVSVGIQKYSSSHPFASLKGADNVISVKTQRYQQPLIIQGAGAGAEVTAAGTLADVIKIAERL